jgi:hypothetical protein
MRARSVTVEWTSDGLLCSTPRRTVGSDFAATVLHLRLLRECMLPAGLARVFRRCGSSDQSLTLSRREQRSLPRRTRLDRERNARDICNARREAPRRVGRVSRGPGRISPLTRVARCPQDRWDSTQASAPLDEWSVVSGGTVARLLSTTSRRATARQGSVRSVQAPMAVSEGRPPAP